MAEAGELETALKQLLSQIEQNEIQQSQIDQLRSKLQSVLEENNRCQAILNEKEESIKNANEANKQLQQEMKSLEKTVETKFAKSTQINVETLQMEDRLRELAISEKQWRSELNQTKHSLESKAESIREHEKTISLLQSQLENFKTQFDGLVMAKEQQTESFNRLQNKYSELETKHTKLQSRSNSEVLLSPIPMNDDDLTEQQQEFDEKAKKLIEQNERRRKELQIESDLLIQERNLLQTDVDSLQQALKDKEQSHRRELDKLIIENVKLKEKATDLDFQLEHLHQSNLVQQQHNLMNNSNNHNSSNSKGMISVAQVSLFDEITETIERQLNKPASTPAAVPQVAAEMNPNEHFFFMTACSVKILMTMKGNNTSTIRYPTNIVSLLYQRVQNEQIPFHEWHDFCLRAFEQYHEESKTKKIQSMSIKEISKPFVSGIVGNSNSNNSTPIVANRHPTTFYVQNSIVQTQSPLR